MNKDRHVPSILPGLWFAILIVCGMAVGPEATMAEPRGQIRVVDNYRPDINVLGHNVLQYLYEYALDRSELTPSLAVSHSWVGGTTLELKLRERVRFHNGEPFDAYAVQFNFNYQRKHNSGRGVQVYMKNVKEIRIVDSHTVQLELNEPDSLTLDKLVVGPVAGWVIGAPKYMEQVGWEEFLKRPVGTGPFIVEGEVKDCRKSSEGEVYARLSANPNYWDVGNPKIQHISFIQLPPKQALIALTEGRVDLVTFLIPKE